MAALSAHNIKATFFVVGTQVVQYPQYLKQAYDAGHLIAMHSWSHRALTTMTNEEIIAEFEYTAQAIESAINARPKYYRPPFGDYDDRVRGVLKAMGFVPVLWNYDTFDYNYKGTAAQRKTVMDSVANQVAQSHNMNTGVILLSHDIEKLPTELLPDYLKTIVDSGANFVTVSQCVGDGNPYLKGGVVVPPTPPQPTIAPPPVVVTSTAVVVETTTVAWPSIPPSGTFTPIPTTTPPISANQATTIFVGFWVGLAIILSFSI